MVTVPGNDGIAVAFVAEFLMAFTLMTIVLQVNNAPRAAPYTGVIVGLLVAMFITFLAPLSGMSINPARTFASAVVGDRWDAFWLYCLAPPLGMLLAAQVFVVRRARVDCAKMYHAAGTPCIFCEYQHGTSPPREAK